MSEAEIKPLVSVIMPAFNAERYIEESILSVKEQTYANWEILIIDDGSTDSTATIVKRMQVEDSRIRYLFQKNRKLGAARNTGIKSAQGEWLAFLDADDLWLPDKLEKQIAAILENDVDIAFTNGYYLREESQQIEAYDSFVGHFGGAEMYSLLFWHNRIAVLSVLLRSSFVDKVGLQDESFRVFGCEDWDYWLRCCLAGARFFGLDQRSFKYRVHEQGMSRNVLNMRMAGCYVLFKNFDLSIIRKDEQKNAKDRLVDEVRFIVEALYEKREVSKVPYYLQLLSNLYSVRLKFYLSIILVKIFKQKSRSFTLFFLYH